MLRSFLRGLPLGLFFSCRPVFPFAWPSPRPRPASSKASVLDASGGALPGATVAREEHGDELRAELDDGPGRPFPRGPAAARALPRHGDPPGLPDPRARRHHARRRSDGDPQQSAARALLGQAGGPGDRRGPRRRNEPERERGPDRREGGPEPAQQRPQLPRLHEADPGRHHGPGARRRRALDQRPEGDPEQHLGRRRRLQQPVLRRAARRPAAARSRSTSTRSRRSSWSPTARTPSSAAPPRASSTWSRSPARTTLHGSGAPLLQGSQPLARGPTPDGSGLRSSTSTGTRRE